MSLSDFYKNYQNSEKLNMLLKWLQEKYGDEGRRDSIHITDLVYCLRKAYFQKTDPIPPGPLDFVFFIEGAAMHAIAQRIFSSWECPTEISVAKYGITGRIDAFLPPGRWWS